MVTTIIKNLLPKRNINANHSIGEGDCVIVADASSSNITVTLPPVSNVEDCYFRIIKKDSSVNTVTIQPSGADTIEGDSNHVLVLQYQKAWIWSDGDIWFKLWV